jgi:hypothetical protein
LRCLQTNMAHLTAPQAHELRQLAHAMYLMCVETETLTTVADVSDLLFSTRAHTETSFTGGVAQWLALVNRC